VAMLIDYVSHPSGGEDGYILEVFNAVGDSLTVLTIPISAVAKLTSEAVFSVRPLAENNF